MDLNGVYKSVINTHPIMPQASVQKKTLGRTVGHGVILSPCRKQSHRPCPLRCGNEASKKQNKIIKDCWT